MSYPQRRRLSLRHGLALSIGMPLERILRITDQVLDEVRTRQLRPPEGDCLPPQGGREVAGAFAQMRHRRRSVRWLHGNHVDALNQQIAKIRKAREAFSQKYGPGPRPGP
jgi:hypothetical protein